jgi:hypothetical protein
MFLTMSAAREWICLLVVMARDGDTWEDFTIVHKPWWNPENALAEDELIAIGGHSRFGGQACPEVVLIPGQAAPQTRVTRLEPVQREEDLVQGPWGHFVCVACIDEPGAPVSLGARRAGAHQTVVVQALDAS